MDHVIGDGYFSVGERFITRDICVGFSDKMFQAPIYKSEPVISKEAFIEAYNKWIKGESDGNNIVTSSEAD